MMVKRNTQILPEDLQVEKAWWATQIGNRSLQVAVPKTPAEHNVRVLIKNQF